MSWEEIQVKRYSGLGIMIVMNSWKYFVGNLNEEIYLGRCDVGLICNSCLLKQLSKCREISWDFIGHSHYNGVTKCHGFSNLRRPFVQPLVYADIKWNISESLSICVGNPPVTSAFPSQRTSNAESVPCPGVVTDSCCLIKENDIEGVDNHRKIDKKLLCHFLAVTLHGVAWHRQHWRHYVREPLIYTEQPSSSWWLQMSWRTIRRIS